MEEQQPVVAIPHDPDRAHYFAAHAVRKPLNYVQVMINDPRTDWIEAFYVHESVNVCHLAAFMAFPTSSEAVPKYIGGLIKEGKLIPFGMLDLEQDKGDDFWVYEISPFYLIASHKPDPTGSARQKPLKVAFQPSEAK